MFGTILNVGAILAGGVIGLTLGKQLSHQAEFRVKLLLGIVTLYLGFSAIWTSLNGPFLSILKQIFIMLAALVIGNLIGKALRLQHLVNRLGDYARQRFQSAPEARPNRFGEGFVTCTILFCVGPMAILGSLRDGLENDFRILGVKSAMDGLATLAFVKTFGWGVMLSAIPVLAYQGTITLAARWLEPHLRDPALLDSMNAAGGLLILCISSVILDIQKVPLADYLPSLAAAPVLTWLFR